MTVLLLAAVSPPEGVVLLVLGVAVWAGFVGWHAGRLALERDHAAELAALRAAQQPPEPGMRFVDHAGAHGVGTPEEITS